MAPKYLTEAALAEEMNKFLAGEDSDDSIRDPDFLDSDSDTNSDLPGEESDLSDVDEPLVNMPEEADGLCWSNNIHSIPNLTFTKNKGVMGNIFQNDLTTPMDIYFQIIDDNVLQFMVTETPSKCYIHV